MIIVFLAYETTDTPSQVLLIYFVSMHLNRDDRHNSNCGLQKPDVIFQKVIKAKLVNNCRFHIRKVNKMIKMQQ